MANLNNLSLLSFVRNQHIRDKDPFPLFVIVGCRALRTCVCVCMYVCVYFLVSQNTTCNRQLFLHPLLIKGSVLCLNHQSAVLATDHLQPQSVGNKESQECEPSTNPLAPPISVRQMLRRLPCCTHVAKSLPNGWRNSQILSLALHRRLSFDKCDFVLRAFSTAREKSLHPCRISD
ncbi:hypothetical protein B0T10DRAFT_97228 [Thelonectria olida]|uniref:Uncharacterized protein n=1 Tax=Thelonectria olida TaxID=1576542 RepID=A0A9P8W1N6_9HYPO|nr:hypothetical protein B0T10DRAFT_97228 [Thelonectria olida]